MQKWVLQLGAPLSGSVTRHSTASPHELWATLIDVTRMGEWSPECKGCEWRTPNDHIEVGAQFRGSNRWGPLRWSTTCTIEVFEIDSCFAYSARHSSGATTRWTYRLGSNEAGTTVTEAFESVNSPVAVLALDRLVGRPRRLLRHMDATLARLVHHVERHGATTGPTER